MEQKNSPRKGTNERRIDFILRKENYIFRANYSQQTATGKIINYGVFDEPPSEAILPGHPYVLIELPITQDTFDAGTPQLRFQYEILNFPRASHLRRILVRNDTSEVVNDYLKRGENLPSGQQFMCRIVEPRYQRSTTAFKSAPTTAYERLELLIQAIEGIQELQQAMCHFDYPSREALSSIAHRDIKLDNILIQPGRRDFTAVLIDLASLKIGAPNGTYTSQPMSASNTTPEGLGLEDGQISEKTDVFAFGGMIGELFGSCNPIQKWVGCQGMEQLRKAYENAKDKYSTWQGPCSWIVSELNDGQIKPKFSWNRKQLRGTGIYNFESSLEHLLYDVTQFSPDKRPSLNELKARIQEFQDQCQESRTFSNANLYIPPRASDSESLHDEEENSILPICFFDLSLRNLSRTEYINRYVSSVKSYLPDANFAVGVYRRQETSLDNASTALINPNLCEGANDLPEFLESAWREFYSGTFGNGSGLRKFLKSAFDEFHHNDSDIFEGDNGLWDALNETLSVFQSANPRFSEREWKALSLWIFTPQLPPDIGKPRYAAMIDKIRSQLSPLKIKAVICATSGAGTIHDFFERPPIQPLSSTLQSPDKNGLYVIYKGKKVYL